MKTLASLLILCSVSIQPAIGEKTPRPTWPTDEDGRVVFQEVVEVEGAEAALLYDRARAWFSDTYVSGESVLDLEDREAGRLIGKGLLRLPGAGSYVIRHQLRVEVKAGRYRYTLSDIRWSAGQTTPTPERPMTDKGNMMGMLTRKKDEKAWDYIDGLLTGLKAAMQSGDTEDW